MPPLDTYGLEEAVATRTVLSAQSFPPVQSCGHQQGFRPSRRRPGVDDEQGLSILLPV